MEQKNWLVKNMTVSTRQKVRAIADAYDLTIEQTLTMLVDTNYEAIMDARPKK